MLARLDRARGCEREFKMLRPNLVVAVLLPMTMPAFAQDTNVGTQQAECTDRFKASDLNKDNVLTVTELPKAQQLPATLAKEKLVSRKEYVAACLKSP